MALYRTVSLSFWTDTKISDDFTPEDRYFYLYLFTNPHTNLSGCYEVSIKQMAYETGYNEATIKRLLDRFYGVHKVAIYSNNTKEVLLFNWHKYNWTSSEKYRKPLKAAIDSIKEQVFKEYLLKIFNHEDCGYGIDTTCMDTECIDTPNTNTVSSANTDASSDSSSVKEPKHKFGEYNHVLLTDDEYQKLVDEYGDQETDKAIKYLDEYIEMKGTKYKSHYLALRKWVFDAIKEKKQEKKNNLGLFGDYKQTSSDDDWDGLTKLALKEMNGRDKDD